MKKHQVLTAVSFFGALMIATSAVAGDKVKGDFSELDLNKDGQLSQMEASNDRALSKKWDQVDQDSSGSIDQSEFSAFEIIDEEQDAPASTSQSGTY